MIPKIIHCCWFGDNPMTDTAKKFIDGWKKLNPDYEIKIWSERNFNLKQNQYMYEAYKSKKWAFVTDYVRLKVLYEYGGIYMDTDVEVKKNLDSLLNNKAFSGFEGPGRIQTGIMGAEKHSKWIELLLHDYDDRHFLLQDGSFDLTTNVQIITDITVKNYPIILNNTYQDLGDVTFYPFEVLCAKDLVDGKIKATENTITVHHFNGSWTSPKKRIIKFLNEHGGHGVVVACVKIKHFLLGGKRC